MRDGFIFYRSFFESGKALNDEERLELFDSICEYSLNQTITEMKPMVFAFFTLMKPQIDANNKKYENGKKGGRPPKNKTEMKPNNNQDKTKNKPNVKEKENVKEKDNVNVNTLFDKQKAKHDFINFESFKKLYNHLLTKYQDVTMVRLTNNIKKLKDKPDLFTLAVDRMIELDYNGLFIPTVTQPKTNRLKLSEIKYEDDGGKF